MMRPEVEAEAGLMRPGTLTDAVAAHIGDRIVRGTYPPGSPLPEVPLAEELRISRGTVREALRKLRDTGLVEILSHRGAVVTELSVRKAREIIGLRAVLEGYAARLTVESGRFTAEAEADVQNALRVFEAEASERGDPYAAAAADIEFHRRLTSYCDHELLLLQLASIQLQAHRLLVYTRLHKIFLLTPAEAHRRVIRAFASGDPDHAEAYTREHIQVTGKELVDRLAELESKQRVPSPA